MKNYVKFMSILMLAVCFISSIYAFEGSSYSPSSLQKHYVQGNDVRVANNGIFVNFEGDILNVPAIYIDDAGAYIAGLGCCSYCGRPNDDMGKCQNARCKNYGKG